MRSPSPPPSTGRQVAAVMLTVDRQVVGFGSGIEFVARTDPDDGLVYLERLLTN